MSDAFFGETTFNEDISAWDTSNVTDMSFMFNDATEFNKDISGWNVDAVINCLNFDTGAGALTPPTFPGTSDCNGP